MENPQEKENKMPAGYMSSFYLSRLGVILSNISIASLIIFVCSLITPILLALCYGVGIILIFATIGTIFVMIPNYWQLLTSFMTNTSKLLNPLLSVLPYVLGIGLATAIASVLILFFDKQRNHKGRIVFGIIVVLLIVVAFVFVLCGGLK